MTDGWPLTPVPPSPFDPRVGVLDAGAEFYRVHSNSHRSVEFNPGPRGAGRFHFFGDPSVPVLYMAQTREAALAETLLRHIPVGAPTPLARTVYVKSVMAGLRTLRSLRIAEFYGLGLRALGVEARQLTDTPGENYPAARKWSQAAYEAGLDGIGWMSHRDNSARSYMLFGGRVDEGDLEIIPGSGLVFAAGDGFDWLVATCAPLRIDVLPG